MRKMMLSAVLPALAFALSACGTTSLPAPPAEVKIVQQTVYPDLPDIDVPSPPPLRQMHVTAPADKTAIVGLTPDALDAIQFNLEQLKAYIGQLTARLVQVNVERAQWRTQNASQPTQPADTETSSQASTSTSTSTSTPTSTKTDTGS